MYRDDAESVNIFKPNPKDGYKDDTNYKPSTPHLKGHSHNTKDVKGKDYKNRVEKKREEMRQGGEAKSEEDKMLRHRREEIFEYKSGDKSRKDYKDGDKSRSHQKDRDKSRSHHKDGEKSRSYHKDGEKSRYDEKSRSDNKHGEKKRSEFKNEKDESRCPSLKL